MLSPSVVIRYMKQKMSPTGQALVLFSTLVNLWLGVARAEEPFACAVHIQEGMPDRFKCLETSGNNALNAKAVSQARHLNGAFDLHIKLCYIDDKPPNAWARTDGKIFVGRNLLRTEFEEHGNIALWGIFAHEWAHEMQYARKDALLIKGVLAELQADCVAGFHIGRFGKVDENEITAFARSLFSKGDYAFNSPTHHGTPETRLSVMMFGYKKGRERIVRAREVFDRCAEEAAALAKGERSGETIRTYQGP